MDTLCGNRIVDEIIAKVDSNESFWVCQQIDAKTVIQNGPQCGIVALCMALNALKTECTVDELMEKARELYLTKNGEIFNVDFLHELAQPYVKTEIMKFNEDVDFFETLLKAKLILIAYDTDFNYEPCNKKGIKAHWALVTGFLLPINHNDSVSKKLIDYDDETKPIGINFIKSLKYEEIHSIRSIFESNQTFRELVYVICKQGKSKNLGVWRLEKLLESNRQLKEVNSNKCDPINFVLPPDGDISKTLSSRFLVFY